MKEQINRINFLFTNLFLKEQIEEKEKMKDIIKRLGGKSLGNLESRTEIKDNQSRRSNIEIFEAKN